MYCYDGIEEWGANTFHKDFHLFKPSEVIPDKRLYPEACDFEFCKLLKSKGAILPFTTYQKDRPKAQYYGDY